MKSYVLLLAFIVGAVNGMTYSVTSVNSANQIYVGGHKIAVVTEPSPKLYIDDQPVNLTTAGARENGTNYVLYSQFPNLPGLSVKFYNDNFGFTVYYENNGVVSRFGTMSPEEQRQFNEQMATTMQNVNNQISQVQQQIGNMMQSLTNMFNQPGWPFVG